ncbi:MAG: sn-glycerol-3-phosphate ABC transporter ATP-binding protein UgpC [Paracoccaceae bacterium]
MAKVTLSGIRKVYPNGFEAVSPCSFDIPDGEFVVLVGPSGCGKSTLLRMIAGLEEISAGDLSIGPNVVNDMDPADRNIAMVFQNYALYPHMTVAKNMGYGLKNRGASKAEIAQKVEDAAKMLNLSEYLDSRPSQLSGGQRQRVAMGRAIVRQPELFLFDEPLSNLDAKLRNQMRIEIKALQRRLGTTAVYVTHDQVEAMTMADRIIVLNQGRIEQIGTPAEVYQNPASTFVASFIGAPPMNLINVMAEGGQIALGSGVTLPVTVPDHVTGPVLFGVRPEDAVPGQGDIQFEIELIEELGAQRLLHGHLGGQPFSISVNKDDPAVTGSVPIAFKPGAIHYYNEKTGRRL